MLHALQLPVGGVGVAELRSARPGGALRGVDLLKGHLGSVRAAIDASGIAKEARDYYPFGLRLRAGGEMAAQEDFTGHHLDAATGGLLYAGARYYMPALARWTTPDPLAGDFPSVSPYNYSMNNPVNLIDPNGAAAMPPLHLLHPVLPPGQKLRR